MHFSSARFLLARDGDGLDLAAKGGDHDVVLVQSQARFHGLDPDDAVIELSPRDGEVLFAQGMNASEFERNPILVWNHDYAQPVGKCNGL